MSASADPDPPQLGVVVVGAGSGTRLGGVDKAFMDVAGEPMLARSVAVFESLEIVAAIVLVVAPSRIGDANLVVRRRAWRKVFAVVAGGSSRQASVQNGLGALPDVPLVAVHDAARPLVTRQVILAGIEAATRHGAAVAAIPVRDTLKQVGPDGETVTGTVDRTNLWAAQTPQVFRTERLRAAYAIVGDRADTYTDDAGIVEAAGYPVAVFGGTQSMVKVTHPDDLEVIESLVAFRGSGARSSAGATTQPSLRVGIGYDIHRLEAGYPLVLGGVVVPHDVGCVGYSDGDALAHAVIDALLGACSLGDIGTHFPPGDARFLGADSIGLMRTAVAHLASAGFTPTSVDATIVLERPRLAPHICGMIARIADALGIDADAVSVKAKSNEGVDAVGRGEAVAVHAVATVRGSRSIR